MDNLKLQEIQNTIGSAKSILVVTHRNPSIDSLAATLSLYLSLLKAGKNVTVACPSEPIVEQSDLVGIDQIKTKLTGKNILVSIEDYEEGSIEKVSYTEEQGRFNLVIQPGEKSDISPEKIKISFQGALFELIFVIDTIELQYLDNLYTQEQKLYSETPIINIDKHQSNVNFGRINIVNPDASSTSEIVAEILQNLNLTPDEDIATNLLLGIQSATRNFQLPNISPSAFEIAGACLRLGAKRSVKFIAKTTEPLQNEVTTPAPKTPFREPQQPQPPQQPREEPRQQTRVEENNKPPEEWLQPKIYKGTTPIN